MYNYIILLYVYINVQLLYFVPENEAPDLNHKLILHMHSKKQKSQKETSNSDTKNKCGLIRFIEIQINF